MTTSWQNWSGSQSHEVQKLALPSREADLADILGEASTFDAEVRAIGSAHSFVPFWTDGYLISLDRLKGLIGVDQALGQATFWAGTKLHEMGEPLMQHGLAMENMGDIDRQSIAGAISTGTHGTGKHLRNVSSQVVGLRLMKADGEVLDLDKKDGELFRAAQVSMGSLGIITQATFQLLPAYYLHEKNWSCGVDECRSRLDELIEDNRHFEFFWDPASDTCAMKTLNMTDRAVREQISEQECIGPAFEIIPSMREHRFNEIEFSLPEAVGWDCFMAVRALMKTQFKDVRWPIEYRTQAADDQLISAASGRQTVTISAHQGARHDYQAFFAAVEALFLEFDGRPHWGKVHTRQYDDLVTRLPGFDAFTKVRESLDREGRFLNPFLRGIFGIG